MTGSSQHGGVTAGSAKGASVIMAIEPARTDGKVQQLREILRNHLLFVAGRGGKRLNLMTTNMSNVVLEGFNFTEARLLFCNMSYANFQGACFHNADLSNSLFVRTNLCRTDFSGATLDGVKFHYTDAQEAKLDRATMRQGSAMLFAKGAKPVPGAQETGPKTVVQATDMSHSNFEGASLQGAYLANCIIRNTNMRNVNLANANLAGADLRGSNLQGANLQGANLAEVSVKGAVLDKTPAVMDALRFNDDFLAHLAEVEEIDAALREHAVWVETQGTRGKRLDLAGRSLRGMDLSSKMLATLSFAGADLSGVNLAGAVLTACDFTEATVQYVNMSGCDLRGANFTRARITFTDFSGADVSTFALRSGNSLPTRFTGATIRNCDLRAAGLDTPPGDAAECKDCNFNSEPAV
jgi:uncharacterized protein YjbI with pentapeptide repeats